MSVEKPYFVQADGCINCSASKHLKEKTGKDYGFDHELMAKCVLMGCESYGFSLVHPFITPDEIMRLAEKSGNPRYLERAKEIVKELREEFYEDREEKDDEKV